MSNRIGDQKKVVFLNFHLHCFFSYETQKMTSTSYLYKKNHFLIGEGSRGVTSKVCFKGLQAENFDLALQNSSVTIRDFWTASL